MNNVCLSGNFVRDPELRSTKTGVDVLEFVIAVNESYKRKDGTLEKKACFVNCEAWDSGAKRISEYFKKGDPILVTGALRMDNWETKEGEKRSKLKVRVSAFEFMNRRKKEAEEGDVTTTDDTDEFNQF